MARARRRKTNASHRRRHTAVRRRTRKNVGHRARTRRRSNPGQIGGMVQQGIAVVGGAVGSKLATQMVLGASNTGVMGYLGNAVATAVLAYGTHMVLKSKDLAKGVALGGTVQIILRAISDFTPYGQYLSLSGLGDYQVANWATPQWLPNGLKSANPAVPNGWGPGTAIAINSSGNPGGAVAASNSGMGSYANWD